MTVYHSISKMVPSSSIGTLSYFLVSVNIAILAKFSYFLFSEIIGKNQNN